MDLRAQNAFVLANMNLVRTVVDNFIGRNQKFKRLRDDLISTGNLALVTAAREIFQDGKAIDSAGSYATTAISRALREFSDESIEIGPSSENLRQRRKRVEELAPAGLSETEIEAQLEKEFDGKPLKRKPIGSPDVGDEDEFPSGTEDFAEAEFEDELSASCDDTLDRAVVALRSRGMKDATVAQELGISETEARCRRHAIRRKFDERQAALSA